MAEALLRRRLDQRGVDARVSSAGTVVEGRPATSTAVEVMAARGIDISGHRSRVLTPALLAGSDLVIVMARLHVREAAVLRPESFPRIYTFKELVRRATNEGAHHVGQPLDPWLARLHDGRRPADFLGTSAVDDVADPIGEPRPVYEQTADELVELTDTLVPLVWGVELAAHRSPGAGGGPA